MQKYEKRENNERSWNRLKVNTVYKIYSLLQCNIVREFFLFLLFNKISNEQYPTHYTESPDSYYVGFDGCVVYILSPYPRAGVL